MRGPTLGKLALAAVAAAALLGSTLGTARADDDHWRHGHRRHEWHEHWRYRPGPPVVVYGAPPPVIYAPPVVYPPPPVVYMPPPAGINVVLPIRIR